jgi:hypothetical protein
VRVDRRVYRTRSGALTLDPTLAVQLAATPGDDLPDEEAAQLAGLLEVKAADRPADKSRRAVADK